MTVENDNSNGAFAAPDASDGDCFAQQLATWPGANRRKDVWKNGCLSKCKRHVIIIICRTRSSRPINQYLPPYSLVYILSNDLCQSFRSRLEQELYLVTSWHKIIFSGHVFKRNIFSKCLGSRFWLLSWSFILFKFLT